MVIESRFGAEGLHDLDMLVERASIELSPVDLEQAKVARRAFSRFGKGRHPAALNYGDCFPYALATVRGEPLLCKGDDFTRTDVTTYQLPAGAERSASAFRSFAPEPRSLRRKTVDGP